MKIDVYSHCIKVTKVLTDRELQAMLSFCKPLVEMGMEKKGKRFFPKAMRTYAAATRDRKEFSFHRNQLQDLKAHLFQRLYFREHEAPITHHPVSLDVYPSQEFVVKQMFPPREQQVGIIEYVCDDGTKYPNWDAIIKMVALQTGKGKALKNGTHVRVPGGWRRIELLRVGDHVVSRDGTPTQVLGVYPQGEVDLYRVTFADGRFVDACGEHLWQSFSKNSIPANQHKVRNTLELKRLISLKNSPVYIPLAEPEITEDQFLPIDPYLLGVLIGDGSIVKHSIKVVSADQFVLDEVVRLAPEGMSLKYASNYNYVLSYGMAGKYWRSPTITHLRELGLWGCRAYEKYIPSIYMQGSIEQRWSLLQGLMDTDGTIDDGRYTYFWTSSKELAQNVQSLVHSLGGISSIAERAHNYQYRDPETVPRPGYNVRIRVSDPSKLFRLPRKKDIITANSKGLNKLKLKVVSIEPIGRDEATCIAVDHPEKLFVAKDFIVTHNTYVAQYCMNVLKLRTAIHFKGGYVERWKGDLEQTFEFKKGQLLIVRGSKDLIALMHMAIEGELKAQVIIITTATMREYHKNYEETNGRSAIYPIKPIDFYPKLGIGFRVGDEIHQEFHNNFKIDLYTHVYRSLSLSATMEASDPFKNKMYAIAYPLNQRHDGGGYDAYIAVTAVHYALDQDTRLRYMGAQGYSHTTFEESVMRNAEMLKAYFKIIERVVYSKFISVFEHGQKMLIFCARVDMCTALVERLKKIHPDFDIVRYVGSEGDSYEDLLEADIGVTTIGSGGTAIDIPNLRVSIMTTAIDSRQSNEQVLGRTRRLKGWPDITPEFIYFVCDSIEQHVKYDLRKREFFRGKVISHGDVRSSTVL